METALYLIFGLFVVFAIYYLFRPTSKKEEEDFNSKNNWRGGF
jgi:hypothetical protein